ALGALSAAIGSVLSLGHNGSPINGKSRKCRLSHVISCVQSQLITSVPPVSVHQCQLSVLINATCQGPSVPHQCHISVPTSAHQCQCPSELPFSVTYQCQSVPPINASQCHISVLPISAISASQCHL
ncbi:unnamed protein product, partial [Staurois parvus]